MARGRSLLSRAGGEIVSPKSTLCWACRLSFEFEKGLPRFEVMMNNIIGGALSSLCNGNQSSAVDMKEFAQVDSEKQPTQPFLDWPNDAGFNASVETRMQIQLGVNGKIPACVAGTLYRTGPGHYKIPDTARGEFKLSHWFDGLTTVHRFEIIPEQDGTCRVFYNSRQQTDKLLEEVAKTGKLNQITFGQKRDPCTSFFQKLKSVFDPVRTTNPSMSNAGVTITTNISGIPPYGDVSGGANYRSGSKFMVLKTDSTQMKTIDMETLEPVGVTAQDKLHPDLKGPLSSAHAQYDPKTGDAFNYNLDFGRVSTYRVFKTSLATGSTEILATISDPSIAGAYIHAFFLTQDFIILGVWVSHISGYGISILWERNIMDAISPFDPKSRVKWLVIDRRNGRGHVATFESPAMFSFHSVNAWQETCPDKEEEVNIFCDVISYPTLDVLHRLYYENLLSTGPGASKYSGDGERDSIALRLQRYKLAGVSTNHKVASKPLKTSGNPEAELLFQASSPLVGDLPTINPHYATKRARYVYSLVDQGLSSFVDGISKFDTVTKEVSYWTVPKHTPSEAIFIPDDTRVGEDSGYLLSVILDGERGTSYLLCLNAKDMKEVGRADVGVAVGLGFHGSHVPA